MTDLLQYYKDKQDARDSQDPANTYITPTGVEVRTMWDPLIDAAEDVGEGIAEGAESFAGGMIKGAENLNEGVDAVLPGTPMQSIAKMGGKVLDKLGLNFRPEVSEDVGDQMVAGVAQVLPGMIPAIRVLKGLGAAPGIFTEIVGGFIGDVATSSEEEAQGLIELIDMIPHEQIPALTEVLTGYITDEAGDPDELNARILAGVPGVVLGPVIEGLGRLAVKAKDSGVGRELIQTMVERWQANKSPLPAGMSIEDVSGQLGDEIPGVAPGAAPGMTIDESLEDAWMTQAGGQTGVRGSTNVLDDAQLTYNQKPIHHWSGDDFAAVGEELGIERLGPASAPFEHSMPDGRVVNIPGGLEGKFTYYDLLTLKAQGIDASQLPEEFHAQLQKKMSRSLELNKLTDDQVWAGLAFGITSPNNPLFPNQLAMSRLRGQGAIDELAASIDWKFGDKVNPDVRKQTSDAIAAKFGLNAGKAGGLGVRGTQDYTRVAEMAKLFKENPEFFRRKRGEEWGDFAERVFSQVAGLRAKTGSFSVVFQDPLEAGISAIDRHMGHIFQDRILADPKSRLQWQTRAINLYNKRKRLTGDRKVKTMSELPNGFIGEMILSEVGKTSSPKFRLNSGEINPAVPEQLAKPGTFITEPEQIELMGESYKAALQANQEEAMKHGLGVFSSQWMLWDRMRRRLEPHENMFPGLERVPRPSLEQAREVDAMHLETGRKDNTKEFIDADGKVVKNPTKEQKENLDFRLRPTKPTENPARLAYFSFPLAMMMMQGEEQ